MRIAIVVGVVVGVTLGAAVAAQAEPMTKVYLNGLPTPVYFNDGDSFKPQAGPLKGAQSRLAGFNTLESQGPVHRWGEWDPHELYVVAKMATLASRRGMWHCETDGKKDGYGRMLIFCKDLDASLIRRGLAHAYSVNETPGDPDLVAAQREAMKARVGMWAHGIPRYVMTSIHSADEGGGKNGENYNRMISTFDAHTAKQEHHDTYQECQWVCESQPVPTPEDLVNDVAAVSEDPAAKAALDGLSDDDARALVDSVIDLHLRSDKAAATDYEVYEPATTVGVDKIGALLSAVVKLDADKKLAVNGKKEDSCFLYVDFHRRYGPDRAKCLQ